MRTLQWMIALAVLSAPFARSQSAATVSVQVNQPGAVVSSNLFGIFFEEINFAGEGGLYAEMVRDRAFYDVANADYWTFVTEGTAAGSMNVDTTQPLNTNIVNSLKLTMTSGSGSVGAAPHKKLATVKITMHIVKKFRRPMTLEIQPPSGSTMAFETR